MEKEYIQAINGHISNGVKQWSDVCLMADADGWAENLEYGKRDVMNACLIFQHICSNIGIKSGRIDGSNAAGFGKRLRELVMDMTGIDTHKPFDD